METLLIIVLIGIVAVILSGAFRTPPPQIIYVQTVTAEPTSGGLGCLPWVIAFLAMLILLGVIRI